MTGRVHARNIDFDRKVIDGDLCFLHPFTASRLELMIIKSI